MSEIWSKFIYFVNQSFESAAMAADGAVAEATGYPPYVYLLRVFHAKEQVLPYIYSSIKAAEARISLMHGEGYSHDLEIVKTA